MSEATADPIVVAVPSSGKEYDVSVIIQSYNRPEYLIQAIKSVLSQNTSRKIEVVVVKNYENDEIDALLNTDDCQNLLSTDNTFMGKIMQGLQKARGRLVCFLDDDDLFMENKVETVANEFEKDPDLIYYHNFFEEIDEKGKAHNSLLMRPAKDDIVIDTGNSRLRKKKELFFFYSYYNTSSISVRRKEFLKFFNGLPEFHTTPVDMHLFFTCCSSGQNIKVSIKKLTRYRIHTDNVTFHSTSEEKVNDYEKGLKLYKHQELNHWGEFIGPLLRARRLDTEFNLYFMNNHWKRPPFVDLIMYIYYSFKRRNRFLMIMILSLYFGVVSRERLSNIEKKRVQKRTKFN